jgi:hypothetical protein
LAAVVAKGLLQSPAHLDRFHETDHTAPNIHFVIPGRRSEAQANPESSNRRQGLLDSGFSIIGLRPMISPRNDHAYDSNFEIAARSGSIP